MRHRSRWTHRRDIPGRRRCRVYEGTVYLKVPVTVGADYDVAGGGFELKFVSQACDARTCQEPTTLPLKVALKFGDKEGAAPDAALAAAAGAQKYITIAPRVAATSIAAVLPGCGQRGDRAGCGAIVDGPGIGADRCAAVSGGESDHL